MVGPIAVMGLDPPEMETIHELLFFYPDPRNISPSAIFAQGYEARVLEGDSVTAGGNGSYVVSFGKTSVQGERIVRIPPGYLWVEERVYTREKKPLKPKPTAES